MSECTLRSARRGDGCLLLRAVLVVVFCLVSATAGALDPSKALTQFNRSSWQDELPQNSVRSILQTREGYLWFGTSEGLARFDGVEFTVFDRSIPGLHGSSVVHLLEDSDGTLWISTNAGLTSMKNGVFETFTAADGLPGNLVNCTCEGPDGNLWVATGDGLGVRREGRFENVSAGNSEAPQQTMSLVLDREGFLWIASGQGLYRMRDGKFDRFTTDNGLPSDDCWVLCAGRDHVIWVGTDSGVGRFQDSILTSLTKADGLPDVFVRAIYEDRQGNLWVGTEDSGLSRIVDGVVTTLGEEQGLVQNHVRSIYEDSEGSLWVGTNGGLNQLTEGKVAALTKQEGLSHDSARAVLQAEDGSIWIGTDGGGLNRFVNGEFEVFTVENGLSSNSVRSLHQSRDGRLWIGTRGGLDIYDGSIFINLSTRDGLSSNVIRAILEDSKGDMWIATGKRGLNRWRDSEVTVFRTEDGLAGNRPRGLFEDRHGDLWVGTYSGASRFRDGEFTNFTTADGLVNDIVFSFAEDDRGNLWIGTDGGLSLYRDDTFTSFDMERGLFNNTVFQLLPDDYGYLWMSSNHGISRVSLSSLYEVADGKSERVESFALTKTDGMKANQCNGVSQPAGWKDSSGDLWFPTVKGVVRIDPGDLRINKNPPNVVLERIVVNESSVDPAAIGTWPQGKGDLEIHYAALTYIASNRVRFRYRLEGYSNQWTDAGTRRTAYYNNLAPGRYRFHVIACNGDGIWNEEGAQYSFVVPAPMAKTWWAYALYCVFAAAVVYACVRFRVRVLAGRNLVLEAEVVKQTAQLRRSAAEVEEKNLVLADKILQLEISEQRAQQSERRALQANHAKSIFLSNMSHELRTPLNSIIGFASILQKKLKGRAEDKLLGFLQNILSSGEHLLGLINEILDLAKIEEGRMEIFPESIDIAAALENVATVMGGVASRQAITIVVSVESDVGEITGDSGMMRQILFNLVSNAVKFSNHDSTVNISCHRLEAPDSPLNLDTVVIQVIDEGIGISEEDQLLIFEEFRQADGGTSRQYEGTGLGLALVRRLLELHGGGVEVQSTLGAGSTFTIYIPVEAIPVFRRDEESSDIGR